MLPQHITRSLLSLLLCVAAIVVHVNGLANCPPGCRCDDNTLVVQCGEGQLDVLPIALNPSIQRLVIRSNRIKTIDSSIQFYADLTFLDLSSNHLMTIPQRTFAYQKKLQELHLNHNKIGQISNKTFIGLSSVTVLNLRGNLISELHQGTFTPLLKVEELNLGVNSIGFIDPRAFDGLKQLRILYLDDNALTSVPDPVIFQTLPKLAELFLGMNTLLSIPSGTFQELKGLTHLSLKGAGLKNISHDSFRGLEELRTLDLSDNRLSRIPSVGLSNMARLEELSIGQNEFESILEGAFVGLKQLKRLDISGALRLKRVMNGAFGTNTNLEYLNLSSNKMLAEVQEGALSGLPHLKEVILKANALTTLAEGLFPWKDLTQLDLSENPIACDCRVMWLRNLLISKNGSGDAIAEVLCEYPERLRGEELKNLNPTLMGCSHTDPRKQALIGALLVGSAATITALALIIYRCRRKIREYLKGGIWGSSALGRKEREYQKTFCDEDYMTRLQHHPCSLGIHSTFPNTYTPHHPAASSQYGMCGIPIGEIAVEGQVQKNCFQQLQVPSSATLFSDKSAFKNMSSMGMSGRGTCGGAIDDNSSFVMHLKPNGVGNGIGGICSDTQKLNHYTKPQFLSSTAAIGDSCYSYADVPILRAVSNNDQQQRQQQQQQLQQQQLRLTQDYFTQQRQPQKQQQQQQKQQQFHYNTSTQPLRKQRNIDVDIDDDDRSNSITTRDAIMDANYIYSNAHYSIPLEPTVERTKTPTPPPLPPALPLRNGMHHASMGRRSFNANSLGRLSHQNTNTNTSNNNNNNNNNSSGSGCGSGSASSSGSNSASGSGSGNNNNININTNTNNCSNTMRNYH